MAEDNKSMDKGRRLLIGFIIVLLLLTAGAYFFGVYYFTEHFLPGSQVNGFNCSYMTVDESEALLSEGSREPAGTEDRGICTGSTDQRKWTGSDHCG